MTRVALDDDCSEVADVLAFFCFKVHVVMRIQKASKRRPRNDMQLRGKARKCCGRLAKPALNSNKRSMHRTIFNTFAIALREADLLIEFGDISFLLRAILAKSFCDNEEEGWIANVDVALGKRILRSLQIFLAKRTLQTDKHIRLLTRTSCNVRPSLMITQEIKRRNGLLADCCFRSIQNLKNSILALMLTH